MASYGPVFRMVKCANCDHYIRRGLVCLYCGDSDVTANIRETALERQIDRFENFWTRLNSPLRIGICLGLLVLLIGYLYLGFNWS